MSRLRLKIEGEDGAVTLRAFVDILNRARLILSDLDSAISANPHGSLEWYIADLRVGSAVAEIEARPRVANVDERLSQMVGTNFVSGLAIVESGDAIPPYFSEIDLGRVKAIAQRLGKPGAKVLEAAHLNGGQTAPVTITEQAGVNVTKLLEPRFSAIGSVIGKLEVISVHGPPRFNVYDAVTKRAVRCRFVPEHLEQVAAALGRRVVVTGIVHRNAHGEPLRVDRPELRILDESETPTTRDLIGLVPDIAGDLSAEEHVRRLRNG